MKVKLITKTPNMLDVVYTGARTCYNAGSPIDMWNSVDSIADGKKETLIRKVFDSGHLSTAEHAYFTFVIEGISRACSHQLVRHRHCSFSQQSQRYVDFHDTGFEHVELPNIYENKIFQDKYEDAMKYLDDTYKDMVNGGVKPEDARLVLPNSCCTNIVVSMNLRELMHLCNERLCTRAQLEIRQMTKLMAKEVIQDEEWLKPYLVPKCEKHGICFEHKSCGRKPTLEELKQQWHDTGYEGGYNEAYKKIKENK